MKALKLLMLNRTHLPFRLKVLNDPAHFAARRDAAVVYVLKSAYEAEQLRIDRVAAILE
jgi:hypothetical protein